MSVLYRVSPRTRKGIIGALVQSRSDRVGPNVIYDAYFGLIATGESGQGAQSVAASASASSPSVFAFFGQGTQSAAGACSISSDVVANTAQGQTLDAVCAVPFIASVQTGQGSQTVGGLLAPQPYRTIEPSGWLGGAIVTPNQVHGLWRLSPRSSISTLASQLTRVVNSGAGPDVVADAYFVYDYNTYKDGFGGHDVALGSQVAVPSGIAPGAFGAASVYNYTQFISVAGISAGAFGSATAFTLNQDVYPSGISSGSFGSASVITLDQHVSVDGIRADVFGTPSLENLDRTIYPQRIAPLSVGSPTIIGPRYIAGAPSFPVSVGKTDVFGSTVVVGPRTVKPSGLAAIAFGLQQVQYLDRTIVASGVIVPYGFMSIGHSVSFGDSQYAYPDGIAPDDLYGPIVGEPPFDVVEMAAVENEPEFGEHEILNQTETDSLISQRITKVGNIGGSSVTRCQVWPVTIRPLGMIGAYGKPTVSNFIRTVDLNDKGFIAFKTGKPDVSNYIRYITASGFDKSVVWNPYGPVDEFGNAPRVYNQYGEVSGLLAAAGLDAGSIGAATVARRMC